VVDVDTPYLSRERVEVCLGIEATAHTFGVGVVDENGEIIVNEVARYPSFSFGKSPTEAAKHHLEKSDELITQALKRVKNISLLAYSKGPGMPTCLLVGLKKVKELASKLDLPVVEVNHCVAHLEIGKLVCKCIDPIFLYLAGGNTQIISYLDGRYRVFGETLDIAIGNLFDRVARLLGLPFPGGEHIEQLAKRGKRLIDLPYSVKGMDMSFSGILTEVERLVNEKKYKVEDLVYSLQQVAFSMVIEAAERAMAHCKKDELLLIGGVARNKELQRMCSIMCAERGAKFYVVPESFSMDNGAMIAWNGILAKQMATKELSKLDINPKWRVDEVEITWIKG